MLTRKDLCRWFTYNAHTGQLVWRVNKLPRAVIGKPVGSRVWLNGKSFNKASVIWCMIHNDWVDGITHLNGDRDDHRLKNLCPLP